MNEAEETESDDPLEPDEGGHSGDCVLPFLGTFRRSAPDSLGVLILELNSPAAEPSSSVQKLASQVIGGVERGANVVGFDRRPAILALVTGEECRR